MKIIFIIILILITCYIAYSLGLFYYRFKIGREIAKETIPYERILDNSNFNLLIIGDSISFGVGAKPEDSLAGLYAKDFPNTSITNRGKSGMKVKELIPELEKLENDKYDLIEIHIGGNDIIRFTPISQLKNDLITALKIAKTKSENVVLVTSGDIGFAPIFPWPINELISYRTKIVLNEFEKIARQENIIRVDLLYSKKEDPFAEDIKNSYAADMFHPGPKGYKIWYDKIAETLKQNNINLPNR